MRTTGRKRRLTVLAVLSILFLMWGWGMTDAMAQETPTEQQQQQVSNQRVWALSIAICVSIAVPAIGAGYAVGKVGAAALGAASEKPELLTRSLVFVALGESIVIFGFLMGMLLWLRL